MIENSIKKAFQEKVTEDITSKIRFQIEKANGDVKVEELIELLDKYKDLEYRSFREGFLSGTIYVSEIESLDWQDVDLDLEE